MPPAIEPTGAENVRVARAYSLTARDLDLHENLLRKWITELTTEPR
jgi:hypothetical protein